MSLFDGPHELREESALEKERTANGFYRTFAMREPITEPTSETFNAMGRAMRTAFYSEHPELAPPCERKQATEAAA